MSVMRRFSGPANRSGSIAVVVMRPALPLLGACGQARQENASDYREARDGSRDAADMIATLLLRSAFTMRAEEKVSPLRRLHCPC
jgi:hypothetical protein